ncbi:MAG: hypothetical protein ACHQM4_02635 [Thermoanaerobaculia bacterium]
MAVVEPKVTAIKVSGIPTGGAAGYHPSDPNWKETSPAEWGLEFVAQRFGATLVISTKNEVQYIHHHYTLEHIHIEIPSDITIVREPRVLGGDGAPDLKPPQASGTALGTFDGHWTFGFEQSSFVACGAAERWWLDTGKSTLPAQRKAALGPNAPEGRGPILFIHVRGRLSPPGHYGHLGAYPRELEITEATDVRLPVPTDCASQK